MEPRGYVYMKVGGTDYDRTVISKEEKYINI